LRIFCESNDSCRFAEGAFVLRVPSYQYYTKKRKKKFRAGADARTSRYFALSSEFSEPCR